MPSPSSPSDNHPDSESESNFQEKCKRNQKEIMLKILKIKEINRDFLSVLGKFDFIPRDKLIKLDYSEKIEEQAPWLKKSLKIKNKNGALVQESENILSDRQNELKNLLNNIESSPKKRNHYIKQFLDQNSVIEKADRAILIKSYENLSNEKLEKELNGILEIFGK